MKIFQPRSAALLAPVLLAAFAHSAQAVQIDALLGTAGAATFDPDNIALTFTRVDNFDIGLGFTNNNCTYNAGVGFSQSCVTYSVTLDVTNNTDTPWTDFHLRVGYGGLWTAENDFYPLVEGEEAFDLSSGVDQPLVFSSIGAGGIAILGEAEDEEETELGIFDIGINWIFDDPIAIGASVQLGFDVTLGDVTGQTNWNTDFFGYPSNDPQTGYALTARLYPTVAAVPEPGTLALLAASLVGLGFAGRRRPR